jgi:uncharacterized protein YecT (DUF1311 family)
MMRGRALWKSLVWALAAGAPLVGAAGLAVADPIYDRCMAAADTTADMSDCGGQLLKREDDRLNAVWKRIYARQSGQTRSDLLAEQRLWISYKDRTCLYFANGEFGSNGRAVSFAACRAKVIAERVEALEALAAEP